MIKLRTIITACTVGNFLEWYDYALFGYLASILGRVFFPDGQGSANLINSLLVFAVGFLMRPLGSLIFGLIGDRIGRRLALILSILFITFPTFIIGLLPSYAQIGIAASVLIVVLRVFQGIPVGGEVGGIMCYLTEIAPAGKKVFVGSWSFFGSAIGFLVSSLEIYAFEKWMSPDDFLAWGWRLSFIFGGLFGFLGWYLRRRLLETPDFEYIVDHHKVLKSPIIATFKNYKRHIFHAFCFSAMASGGFYVAFLFMSIFLSDVLKLGIGQGLLINAGMMTLSTTCLPFFGKLGDRYGLKPLMKISGITVLFISYFVYYFATAGKLIPALICQAILTVGMTFNFAALPTLLSKIFPSQVRYTGLGFAYNLANAVLGGSAPLFALYLIQLTGSSVAPAFFMMALGAITLIPFLFKDPVIQEIR